MAGFLFSGRYWVDFEDAEGNSTGLIGPLNTSNLEIQHQDPDVIERISNMPQNRGQALDTVSTPKPQQLSITVDDQIDDDSESPEVLARGFGGAVSAFTQAGGTDIAVAGMAYKGKSVDLGQRGITEDSEELYVQAAISTGSVTGQATGATATTLVDSTQSWTEDDLIGASVLFVAGTNVGDLVAITDNDATSITVAAWGTLPDTTSEYVIVDASAALTKDVDYTVDYESGLVKVLFASVNVSDGDMIAGTVDSPAMSGYTIAGAQEPTVTFSVRGYGVNLATKKRGWLEIDKVEAKVSENPNLAAGDAFMNTTLSGTLITVAGQTAPYRFNVELS
jgi:hypothetical protein